MNLTFNNKNITIDQATFDIVESPIDIFFNIEQLSKEMTDELKTAIDIDKSEMADYYAKHKLYWSDDIYIEALTLCVSIENGIFSYFIDAGYFDAHNDNLFGCVNVNIDLHQYDGYFKKIILNELKSRLFDGE